MTARIAQIWRYPVKSIGGEGLDAVHLSAARRLPGDREWAVLTEGGERHAGEVPARWLPKSCFLRGAAAASLQAVKGGWQDGRLHLSHLQRPDIAADPETEGADLVAWLRPLWPDSKPAPTRIVRGPTGWTDVAQPWISILSLDSLAALEGELGRKLGTERWRANLWVEGWQPGQELELIGQILNIGDVELRVTEAIGRCEATSADTDSGEIDIDMPAALERLHGHRNFGIYAEVVTGGDISTGAEVRL